MTTTISTVVSLLDQHELFSDEPLGNCSHDFSNWTQVSNFVDHRLYLPPSLIGDFISHGLPTDALTVGQLASKTWMLREMALLHGRPKISVQGEGVWAILGSWVGLPVNSILTHFDPERIYGIDVDPRSKQWSESLNHRWVSDGWRYKGVTHDVESLDCSDMMFITDGEAIDVTPDVVINTSAEHMSDHWFTTCDSEQLVIIQTNDNPDLPGHTNTCETLEQMKLKYPMGEIHVCASLRMPGYTRHMLIGYPAG